MVDTLLKYLLIAVKLKQQQRNTQTSELLIYLISEWCQEGNIETKLEEMEESDLDVALRKFYAKARRKDGKNYSRSALLGFRYAIERFLNGPPMNRGFKICKNPVFFLSNQMLDAKIKQLKREGNDTTVIVS